MGRMGCHGMMAKHYSDFAVFSNDWEFSHWILKTTTKPSGLRGQFVEQQLSFRSAVSRLNAN
jgi:hypothetical protein